jgi:alcohol dehydrogenase class IV
MTDTTAPRQVSIWPNRLQFGVGALDRLGSVLDDLACKRALVLCGHTVASGDMLVAIRATLGPRLAGVWDGVRAHTPLPDLRNLLTLVQDSGADALITVGGGSAIDTGKAISLLMAAGEDLTPFAIRYTETGMARRLLPSRAIVHIAIPTTSGSGSEALPTAGVRDPERRIKMLFWDDLLIPDAVILDPRLAIHAAPELTAATGVTAVARAVECLYSRDRNPFADSIALHALKLLRHALPLACREPHNLQARSDCQYGCTMSAVACINAMVSLVHAVGHVVGGRHALQHGVSHAILLGPAMRLLLPSIGPDQRFVQQALCGTQEAPSDDAAGQRAAAEMDALVRELPLKNRLRDLGISEDELHEIALRTPEDYMMANLPRPITVPEIEAFLQDAW